MAKKAKKPTAKKGRGTIAVLSLLLLGSAALRLVASAEEVWAANPPAQHEEPEQEIAQHTSEALSDLAPLLEAIQQREEAVARKEVEIEQRMRALEIADGKIEERLGALRKAQSDLRDTMSLASTAAEDDLSRLTAVYENMKPKIAAALFQEMDPEFAAGFLGRMKPNAAAAVMAGMPAQNAYAISAILAGRNANVPKN